MVSGCCCSDGWTPLDQDLPWLSHQPEAMRDDSCLEAALNLEQLVDLRDSSGYRTGRDPCLSGDHAVGLTVREAAQHQLLLRCQERVAPGQRFLLVRLRVSML